MRGGDLSNKSAPTFGMRFEEVLKVNGKFNVKAARYIDEVMKASANLHIITTGDERKAKLFSVKHNIPYTQVIGVEDSLDIPEICYRHQFIAYFDSDKDILERVDAKGIKAIQWTLVET